MNIGLLGLASAAPSNSIISNGILNSPITNIQTPYGLPQGRGAGIDYENNLVFLFDTSLEADNIVSFSLSGTVNVSVDWGDGSKEFFQTTGTKSHTYGSEGKYIVQIRGTLTGITFASMTGRAKLVSCLSFGSLSLLASCTFNGCSNLISVPNQIPRTFTSLNSMFANCTKFNDNSVCSWDTSNITNMGSIFLFAAAFNRPVNSWNTKKVTTLASAFQQSAYNQTLGSWITSSVTSIASIFNQQYSPKAFNQEIDQWDTSSVTNMSQAFSINNAFNRYIGSWNTSKVTTMQNMFYQSSSFNSDITSWNISSVTNMAGMFFQSPFNQNIGSWNVSGVQNMNAMLQGVTAFSQDISSWNIKGFNATTSFDNFLASNSTFGTTNLNAFYIALNNNKTNYRTDLRPNFGSNTYWASSAAAAARAALVTYGWTITDGGTVNAVPDAPTAVSGTAGNAQVSLSWTAPTYNNGAAISDYTIQYSSNSGSTWSTFSHTASSSTSITVTGLTNNTAYIFRVSAVNSVGTGSYSSNSSSVTPVVPSFSPVAYVITSGTSRTVPTGATSMKAWVIGGGGGGYYDVNGCGGFNDGGYAGEAVRTYTVTGGNTITYAVGAAGVANSSSNGGTTTLTYGGVTITGPGGGAGFTGGANSTGSGGDFNRSFYAGGVLDFQSRVAAVSLAGTSLNAGFKGTATGSSSTNGASGGIVLYFT